MWLELNKIEWEQTSHARSSSHVKNLNFIDLRAMSNAKDFLWRNHHSPVETCRNNGSNYVSSHFKDIIFDVARVIMSPTGKNTIKQSSSATRKHIKPCHGWKKAGNSAHNFVLKKKLVSDLFDNRLKLYLLKSVNNMETHLKCSSFSPSRHIFLLLFQYQGP